MIDTEFINIIEKISTEKGNDIFLEPKKIKPLLHDYAKNEYTTEIDLLLRILETDSIRFINVAENLVDCKLYLVKLLEDKYSLSPAKSAEMLDLLFQILRGKTVPLPVQTTAVAAASAVPVSNTSQNQARQNAISANFVFIKGETNYFFRSLSSSNTTINAFFIANRPVTQDEWFEVMGTTQREQMKKSDSSRTSYYEETYFPMSYVNWFEAIDYCNRLSQNEGLTPVYSGPRKNPVCDYNANGYRLPSKEEWEYTKEKYGDNRPNITFGEPNSHGFYFMNFGHWYYPRSNTDDPFDRRSELGFRLVRARI